MRVVHLSASDLAGGAARAAFRLHQGLRAAGVDSTMLVQRKDSQDPFVQTAPGSESTLDLFARFLELNLAGLNRTPVSNTHFSINCVGQDVTGHPLVREAEVIHLHWVAGFQSPATLSLLARLGKPIVWTLHDQRPFTGGCHFSAGCDRYTSDCSGCPQLAADPLGLTALNLADQRHFLPATLTVVTPSRWLASCARQSRLFQALRIEAIPNGIDPAVFQPEGRLEARRKLGLPAEGLYLLAGADHGVEKRKGFAELAAALRQCAGHPGFAPAPHAPGVTLLCFGRPSEVLNQLPIPSRSLGYVDSDERLRSVYSAADLFVAPSLEDNLPTTVIESLGCGTPVAAFRVGGVPELVADGQTGGLASEPTADGLAQVLLRLVRQPEALESMRPACRAWALGEYTLQQQARRHAQLYSGLLSAPGPARVLDTPVPASPLGPHWEKAFPAALAAAFGGTPSFPHAGPAPDAGTRRRRRAFIRATRRLVLHAVGQGRSHQWLMPRLELPASILKGASPWLVRARIWLGR